MNHSDDISLSNSLKSLFQELNTSKDGLSDEEAARRLIADGPNVISDKKEIGIVLEFLSHFKSPLILILIVATGISLWFGQIANSIIVGVMILASVILDFVEEHQASNAAKKLKEQVSSTATVIRAGVKKEIKTSNVCVGDVIFLCSGDLIPADARVFRADDFFVNQSALTGESFPHEKFPEASDSADTIVFLGSSVVRGTAYAIIFKTGKDTEFGKIAETLLEKDENGALKYTPAVCWSLLLFYAFALQCMSTIAVVKRETKSWTWVTVQLVFMSVLAYVSAFLAFRILS